MKIEEYKREVARILFMLASVFRDKIENPMIEAWTTVMHSEGVAIEDLQRAAVLVMKSREYNKLPTPAVLLDLIRPRVDTKAIAQSQADLVLEQVRRVGPYQQPAFDDPVTASLMSTRWPWSSFAATLETDKKVWWRKEFVEAYESAGKAKQLPPGDDKKTLKRIKAPPSRGSRSPSPSNSDPHQPAGRDAGLSKLGDVIANMEGE